MGNNLFGANISGKIAAALGAKLLPGVLTRIAYAAPNPANLTAPLAETPTNHTFRGIYDQYDSRRMGGTAIQEGARVVLILADTLSPAAVPQLGDKILLEGETTEIVGPVLRDPDAASYIAEVAS